MELGRLVAAIREAAVACAEVARFVLRGLRRIGEAFLVLTTKDGRRMVIRERANAAPVYGIARILVAAGVDT